MGEGLWKEGGIGRLTRWCFSVNLRKLLEMTVGRENVIRPKETPRASIPEGKHKL